MDLIYAKKLKVCSKSPAKSTLDEKFNAKSLTGIPCIFFIKLRRMWTITGSVIISSLERKVLLMLSDIYLLFLVGKYEIICKKGYRLKISFISYVFYKIPIKNFWKES